MSDESGVSLSKPVPALKKSIKVNFKDFSKALGKAGVDIAFGKWDSLAGDGVDALAALGLAANAGEVAWLLVYRSLLQAMKTLIDEKTELEPEKFNAKALQTNINEALETSSLTINKKFFEHPDKDSVVEAVKPAFVKWLKECRLSEADAQAISDRLPIYFAAALHEEWGSHAKDYAVLKEKLDTPFTQTNERVQAWLRYGTWLQKQVEEPMFLEAFSLKRVYVPLRAYYNRKVEGQKAEALEARLAGDRQAERVVVDLEKELEIWLNKAVRTDAIRLISGGPGSGKSSFAKMFAAKMAAKGTIPVLFIPLHHFELLDDLIDAVGKFVQMDGILPHNPLASDQREPRLLIIFDGLDELAMQGKIAEKTAQDFVREVQRKVERLNLRDTCVHVLISGRELVVQANETDFRKDGQILHVLPYFMPEHERKHYVGAKKLLEQDQRQLWWQNYGAASGSGYTGLPIELDQGNLTEITAQPLLNYLVALSLRRGKLKFSEATNLNAVYADLIKAIYERGWAEHQHAAIQGIEEKDFVRILEEIALAAWHGKGRTTTVQEIERHCDNSNLKDLLSRFQGGFRDDSKASITRLLTAFYFRQSGHDHAGDKTFEFTHKSFGEYLAARRIVQEVQYIHRKLQDRYNDSYDNWDERSALYRWAIVCGPSAMDEYLFNFVLDEIYLQNLSDVAKWQQTLCHLIGFMLRHGMPMEDVKSSHGFKEKSQQARNAEEALLAVLNACARVTEERSTVDWGNSKNTFGKWISKLQGQRTGPFNSLALSKLSFLNLEQCILYVGDFWGANLYFANFEEAQLDIIVLCQANLQNANFRKASLWRANLSEADLSDADLRDTDLVGVDFRHATLARADFRGASLAIEASNENSHGIWKTNLEGANLEGANLEGVNLEGVNLEGANLKGTILEGKLPNGSNEEAKPERS
ncbi:MAG: pentapeptide repeat-containing protein [Leptolyngbya sp. BL-A-14]